MKRNLSPFNGIVLTSLLILLLSLIQINCNSQVLVSYDFFGCTGNETEGKKNFCISGMQATSLKRSNSIKPYKIQNMFCSGYWSTDNKIDLNKYIEFTLSPDCGKSAKLTKMRFFHQKTSLGPTIISARTSMDGFTSGQGESIKIAVSNKTNASTIYFSLPEITEPLTIRIYAYNSEREWGQWGIINYYDNEPDLIIYGKIIDLPIQINEIDAETQADGCDEFVELYDGGCGNKSLNNHVLVFYEGSTGKSYKSIDLSEYKTNQNGYFTIGSENTENANIVCFNESDYIKDGSNAIALYSGSASDYPIGSLADTLNLLDAVLYKGETPESELLTHLLKPDELSVDENNFGKAKEYSIQRIIDGSGGARRTNTFSPVYPTPGEKNFDAVWAGSLNNEWSEGSNWIPSHTPPEISDNVFIPSNVNNYPDIQSLETIGKIVLDDDAQINGQEYLNSSNVEVLHKIYFNPDHSKIERWQYLASPFQGIKAYDILSQNNRVDLWIAEYDNSLSENINDCWSYITIPEQTLDDNKGFAITSINDETEEGRKICSPWYILKSKGTLKSSDSPVSYDMHIINSGWHLIGNPFLAPIDWFDNNNIDYTNIQGRASYIYNPVTENYLTLISDGEGSGTVVPSTYNQYIPAMQGFFVEANNNGVFYLNPDSRSNTKSSFLKSNDLNDIISISVGDSIYEDETIIAVKEEASNEFDRLDAHKFITTQRLVPQVFTECADEHKLVYNCVKNLSGEIPVIITGEKGNTYNLKINVSSIQKDSYKMKFKNLNTNEEMEITNELNTKITISEEDSEAKFILSIYKSQADNEVLEKGCTNPRITFKDGMIICDTKNNIPATITIYNYSGMQVAKFNVLQNTSYFPIPDLSGIHILNFISNKHRFSQKINF